MYPGRNKNDEVAPMKKALFLILSLLISFVSRAGLYGEVDYSLGYHTNNEFRTSTGLRTTFSGEIDVRYLGLGLRYIFSDIFVENLNVEPLIKGFIPAKDRDFNTTSLYEFGTSVSYSFEQHQPFVSLMGIGAIDPH